MLAFGNVKIKRNSTTQEIIDDINILIDLIKQIWYAKKNFVIDCLRGVKNILRYFDPQVELC